MTLPMIKMDESTKDKVQEQFRIMTNIILIFLPNFCSTLNIDENRAKNYIKELFENLDVTNYCAIRTIHQLCERFFHNLKTEENYIAAPGTILNAVFLYVLIREHNLKSIFESGTASGFYSSFLLLGAMKTDGHIDSVDLIDDEKVSKSIIYDDKKQNITFYKGTNSINFLKEKNLQKCHYDLYCHDSQHTFVHMVKELQKFKECEKDTFFMFFDDQRSENFWEKCIKMGLFSKKDYKIFYTNEEKQLGGFIMYKKSI